MQKWKKRREDTLSKELDDLLREAEHFLDDAEVSAIVFAHAVDSGSHV